MSIALQQKWRCLRGHENEPEMRRCEVCRLPRWVNWHAIAAAGIVLLIGLGYGGYTLSQSLKKWQYQSAVKQAWTDVVISPAEHQELDAQKIYLGLSEEQARQWEEEITGAAAEPPLAVERPPEGASPPSREEKTLTAELQNIQGDLEQGRLNEARQAVTALYAKHPQDAEIGRLKEQIEQKVRSRIEVKLLGTASGTHILDAQVALVTLSGREASFRFYVEPYENVYFYLYGMDQAGSLRVLFPVPHASGGGSNPLLAKQAYWVPSEIPEQGFPLRGEEGQIKEITMVTSRWPARELEQWGAAVAGMGGEEASHHLRQALKERQEAQVGGCDVRILQFAR